MGNAESGQEDQDNTTEAGTDQIASDPVCLQNGPATIQNAQFVSTQKSDLVDARTIDQKKNVDISSQKTMEISSVSDENRTNPGAEAKSEAPPARSLFRMSLSRPVPGRTEAQANDSSAGSVKLDVSPEKPPANNAPSKGPAVPPTAQLKGSSDKKQAPAPSVASPTAAEVPTTQPSEEDNTPSKPKEISLFDKLFKTEKAKETQATPGEDSQESPAAAGQDPLVAVKASSGLQSNAPPKQNIAGSGQNTVNPPSIAGVQEPGENQESDKTSTPTEDNSVMSFFKTLVSNKPTSKTEEEPKKEPEEKKKGNGVCRKSPKVGFTKKPSKSEKAKGGLPALELKTETQAFGSKTKSPDSPKSKKGTLSRLFGHKSAKEAQPTTGPNAAPGPAVVSVTAKTEKASPAHTGKQDTKSSDSAVQQQQQITKPPESQKDDAKDKAKESTPRARPFWKKSVKEEPQANESTEKNAGEQEMDAIKVESTVQASVPSKDDIKSQEADDKAKKSKGEESKPQKPKLMSFFKQLSVIGDGGNANSVEVNEKDPNQPTLDSTDGAATKPQEKSAAPAAVETQPAAQKTKDASKDKKPTVELSKQKGSKQETKENQDNLPSIPPQALEPGLLQNGEDSPRGSPKRLEKRQSFGAFFKGIGSKRTCDAESQTDPVSILPAEKTK